jgi:hypothetical protein
MTVAQIKSGKAAELKLDFGCGPSKKEGFTGVDKIAFKGVDYVLDIGKARWPWKSGAVAEAHSSHFVEHLTALERIHFCNELHRVLIPGGKCTVIVPHWSSSRAYGDPTHQWPPIGEMWFMYLNREWRTTQAPHTDRKHWKEGYDCDFEATWGYGMNPNILQRNAEFQQFAISYYKEACHDIHATLTKRV